MNLNWNKIAPIETPQMTKAELNTGKQDYPIAKTELEKANVCHNMMHHAFVTRKNLCDES